MSDLLNQTLGAVGQVGDAFDKFTGGRALRGAIAGKPRELLSVLPFSDTAGITDAKDKTSGRDLTDAYGLTRKGDSSFGSHALGFAADTVLSPGNLIAGYGALKAAPTLAKGLTNGVKALTGLDAFEGLGRGLGRLAKGEAGSLGVLDPAAERLSRFTAFDNAQPGGLGAYDLVHHGGATRPSMGGQSFDLPSRFGDMPGHQQERAAGIIGSARDYTSAREAQGGLLSHFLGDESGSFRIPNTAKLNDSLRKYLPWAGQLDIPSSVREAAAYIGPQYGGGKDKLLEAIHGYNQHWGGFAEDLAGHPGIEKMASEIPDGTKFLANGAEAVALRTPQGSVIRMAPSQSKYGSAGRADIPEILQPFRSLQIPGDPRTGHSPWIVEHLPMVDPVWPGDSVFSKAQAIRARANSIDNGADLIQDYHRLMQAKRGLNEGSNYLGNDLRRVVQANHPDLLPWDFHGGNVAMTREGNAIGHDGGMVSALEGQPPIERWSPRLQRPQSMAEAEQLGASDAVRAAMERGLAAGTKGQGVSSVPGSDLAAIMADQGIVRDFMAKYEQLLNREPVPLKGVTGVAGAANLPELSSWRTSDIFRTPATNKLSLLAMLGVGGAAAYQGAN